MKLAGNLRLKSIDKGFENIKKLWGSSNYKGEHVEVGYSDGAGEDVVKYAMVHEFGSATNEERKPIRRTIDANKQKYKEVLHGILIESLAQVKHGEPKNIARGLEQLGRHVVADVRAEIKSGIPPPLLQSTLDEKARLGYPSTALIRTGKLLKSVASTVVAGGKRG
jgi:hypothetical protein